MGMHTIMFSAVDAEVLKNALLNTVMCISIVFILLIFISIVIYAFKYIGIIENKINHKKEAGNPAAAETSQMETEATAADTVDEYEEELSDDLELAAVIMAAIHAYEESQGNDIPADGLVVRSIRKTNQSKWQNA